MHGGNMEVRFRWSYFLALFFWCSLYIIDFYGITFSHQYINKVSSENIMKFKNSFLNNELNKVFGLKNTEV